MNIMKDINDLTKNVDLKYERWYNNLIEKARSRIEKDPNDYYEVHHIIPKSLGGTNDESNLVTLTYREHIIAHMLLSEIYPNNTKLIFAARAMLIHNSNSTRPDAIKYISTRSIARIKQKAIEVRRGMKMPEGFGERIAEHNRNRVVTEETKKKISNANTGKKRSEKQLEVLKRNSWEKGYEPWNKGMKMSEETKKKLSDTRKNIMTDDLRKKYSESAKKRGFCGPTKKVQGPDGTVYESTEECARQHNVTSGTIRYWIRKHPEKGYKFID